MGSSLYDIKRKNHYVTKGLSVFVATCLVVSLAPTVAFGSTAVGVRVEAPVQISKTEQIVPVEEISKVDKTEIVDPSAQASEATVTALDTGSIEPAQVTADIQLTQQSTILQDGLEYSVNSDNKSVTLVGWYGNAPEGDVLVPSTIRDGANTYAVTIIRGGANS